MCSSIGVGTVQSLAIHSTLSAPDKEDHWNDQYGGEEREIAEEVRGQSCHVVIETQVIGEVQADGTAHIQHLDTGK